MQSTYTPYTLTTVMPGGAGLPVSGGDDGFMEMAKTLFQRRMQQSEQDRRKRQGGFGRAVSHAAPAMSPNALGSTSPQEMASRQVAESQARVARAEADLAEQAARPAPTFTPFSMNASSTPNQAQARVIDWNRVSLGNLPKGGGFAQSGQMAAAGDQELSRSLKEQFDDSTAIGEAANATGKTPSELAFEMQLRRLLAARGRMG